MSEPNVKPDPTPEPVSDTIESLGEAFGDLFSPQGAPEPAAPEPTPEPDPAPEETPEPTPEPTPPEGSTPLSPLLAERSKRERELRAELEKATSTQSDAIAAAKAGVIKELLDNPQEFIAKHNIDNVEDLALHFYTASLGEDAPADLRAQVGQSDLDKFKRETAMQFEQLRLEAEQRVILARNDAVLKQYEGFITAIPQATHPYLAVEGAHSSEELLSTMAQVADHIQQTSGEYPSASEVATIIERQLEETAARYAAINTPKPNVTTPQTVPVKEKKQPITTLSTENSGASGKRLPVGEDELFADALTMFENMT